MCGVEESRDMNIDQDWFWDAADHYRVELAPS